MGLFQKTEFRHLDGRVSPMDDIVKKEGIDWNSKALDRRQWKALIEGCILQWMDKALVKLHISLLLVFVH